MLIMTSFSHDSVKHKILQFWSLIFHIGHWFYFPKIIGLLAEWKEVGVYSIAYEFSEGSPPYGPFSSRFDYIIPHS
jgi:hypothetical protein